MKTLRLALAFCVLATTANAATLLWDAQTVASPLTVERSATETGPYVTVATLPTGATSYILAPGAYGWYRVRYSGVAGSIPSNVVQFSLDLYTGVITNRLDALEARVLTLETPAIPPVTVPVNPAPVPVPAPVPTSNFTITQIDADHVRLTCNGIGITTSGSGTSRTLECRH